MIALSRGDSPRRPATTTPGTAFNRDTYSNCPITFEMSDSEPETEYELEAFTIGGHHYQITTIAYLPIELLMANRAKQTEISGQKLWCGSLGLIQHILNNPSLVDGKVVVELGAGTGVLGMVCARQGAKTVFLTDHDQISLNHMIADCSRNHIDAVVKRLDWYRPTFDDWDLDSAVATSAGLVIVAGDVVYKDALLDPFFSTASLLLQKFAGVKLYLCHIPRAGVDYAAVLAKAESFGLVHDEVAAGLWNTGECFQYCDPDDLVRARMFCFAWHPRAP
jgi:hypothetical protein